jgi:hypothetical protein
MKQDPLDRLGERLFDAARRETSPEGAQQRAILAALREAQRTPPRRLPRGLAWTAAFGAVSLAAGIALWARPQRAPDAISAEPALARSNSPEAAASAPPLASEVAPMPSPINAKRPSALPVASLAPSAAATLTDELEALKVASDALSAGDAHAALSALDRYDRLLKGGKLRAEATMLRIQALARSGSTQAASALAQRFVAGNPESPLVDRARSFIQAADLGGN